MSLCFDLREYEWKVVANELPPEGKLVIAMDDNHNVYEAKRYGHGWERTVNGKIINLFHICYWAEMK